MSNNKSEGEWKDMSTVRTGEMNGVAHVTEQSTATDAVVDNLALYCEHLWNESGRAAACEFARSAIELESLRSAVRVGDPLTRTKALYLFSLFDPSDVHADIADVLKFDECEIVRHEAAYFLGTMHFSGAADCLGECLLRDPSEIVRHEAAEALGESGCKEGLQWLEQAKKDPSLLVRATIDIAIRHILLKSASGSSN